MVGIDLGARRIGVAVSDSAGRLASPRCTISRTGDAESDRETLAQVVADCAAERVVVGLPVSLDGTRGPAARSAEKEAAVLREVLAPKGIEVELFDERLTTVSAQQRLAEAGVRGKSQRKVVDQAAAAVMLQAWLDAHARVEDTDV